MVVVVGEGGGGEKGGGFVVTGARAREGFYPWRLIIRYSFKFLGPVKRCFFLCIVLALRKANFVSRYIGL